jgi:hypothetical protein
VGARFGFCETELSHLVQERFPAHLQYFRGSTTVSTSLFEHSTDLFFLGARRRTPAHFGKGAIQVESPLRAGVA